MRIGIIAEGPADLAVVTNILIGALGVSRHEVQPLRPDLHLDETDLARRADRFGNWALVREECRGGDKIADFMASPIDDGARMVVIQLDTAEAPLYGVERPPKTRDELDAFADELRSRVVAAIESWLAPAWHAVACHAVAVEEIDAWVLAVWASGDSVAVANPKDRLVRVWSEQVSERERRQLASLKTRSEFGLFDELSRKLRKPRELRAAGERNVSLRRFVEALAVWRARHGP